MNDDNLFLEDCRPSALCILDEERGVVTELARRRTGVIVGGEWKAGEERELDADSGLVAGGAGCEAAAAWGVSVVFTTP